MESIFVRAKPSKIAIKETYYYEGSVGDNSSWKFDGAEGEIEFVFPFDGYYTGCFDRAAQRDLEKQDPNNQAKKVLVGYLGIAKAGKTSFKKTYTLPIILDVEDIREKLEGSQEQVTKLVYHPDTPETEPFLLSDVKLTDQDRFEDDPSSEYKPQYYPFPTLRMTINTPIRGDLFDLKDLSPERVKEFIKLGQDEQAQEIKFLPGDCSASTISTFLLDTVGSNRSGILIIGLDLTGKIDGLKEEEEKDLVERVANAALMSVPPVPIFSPVIVTIEEDGEKRVGVVVTPSGLKNRFDREPEEPTVNPDLLLNTKFAKELLKKPRHSLFAYREIISPDDHSEVIRLAKRFAALANGGGGYVLFGVEFRDGDYTVTGLDFRNLDSDKQIIKQALRLVKPWQEVNYRKNRVSMKRSDGSRTIIVIVEVSGELSEVYSVENGCYQIESGEKGPRIREMTPKEILKLFTEKYKRLLQRTVVKGEPPKIAYGYLKWPHTSFQGSGDNGFATYHYTRNCGYLPGTSWSRLSSRDEAYLPSKYDPLQGAMEWHEVPLSSTGSSPFYEATLQLVVKNPEELRDPDKDNMTRDLPACFELLLGLPLLSGLEVLYFDARGEKLKPERQAQIISLQTKVVLKMCLRTSDLFKKRDFSPYRQLEFEGVLPERSRYDDVREALQDCGLRTSQPMDVGGVIQKELPRETIWHAESRTELGKFTILLRIINYWYEIEREVSYGERTDKMQVPSGRMTIGIFGAVKGAENKDLTVLLNKLQIQLKERFKFVRVG